MKQEPFGWYYIGVMFEGKDGKEEAFGIYEYEKRNEEVTWSKPIPLYTEPQYRELSDEEIIDIGCTVWGSAHLEMSYHVLLFAHKLLKKASEK